MRDVPRFPRSSFSSSLVLPQSGSTPHETMAPCASFLVARRILPRSEFRVALVALGDGAPLVPHCSEGRETRNEERCPSRSLSPVSLLMSKVAIYAGTFDPVTRGHQDLIARSLTFCDRLVVAVASNSTKAPLFNGDERVALVRQVVGDDPRVDVRMLKGQLLVSQ